jgi:hypothetical protein
VFYYLELYSNIDRNSKAVYLGSNLSTNVERYDEFQITEGTEDLDNGVIELDSGTYDYRAWECTAQDFDTKVSIVESGKCIVPGEEPTTSTFTESRNVFTFK